MNKKFFLILTTLFISFSIFGCGSSSENQSLETSSENNISIELLKEDSFTENYETMGFNYLFYDSYKMYCDKNNNTLFVKFRNNQYGSIMFQLVDVNKEPKQYSKTNKNKLELVECNNEFLIFEDIDTNVQYIIDTNFESYIIRYPKN